MSWFKPKTQGYGAAPSNWKGWAAILVFVVVETALAVFFIVGPALANTGPGVLRIVAWCLVSGAFTLFFIRFTMLRTDGVWRWRWGDQK
mgnify:FL=1